MDELCSGVLMVEMDGVICEFEGGFTVQPNSEMREEKISHAGKVGIKRTPIAPGFKGTMQVYDTNTAKKYHDFVNKPCSIRTRGRVYSFTGATSKGTFEHDLVEGTVEVECFAQKCTET